MSTFQFRSASCSLALAAMLGLAGLAPAAEPAGQDAAKLNPEQRKELTGRLYEDFHKSTGMLRRELIAKHHELEAALHAPGADQSKIQALAGEISGLRAKLFSAHIALRSRLIQEGLTFGYGGYGPGKGGDWGCPGRERGYGCPGMGRGPGRERGYGCPGMGRGYGPGMGRGYGSGPGGGASCCDGSGGGSGPGAGGGESCCDGPGGDGRSYGPDAGGQGFGTGSGIRGRYGQGGR